jgi:hypothetical protein
VSRNNPVTRKRAGLFKQLIKDVINGLLGDYVHWFTASAKEAVRERDPALGG